MSLIKYLFILFIPMTLVHGLNVRTDIPKNAYYYENTVREEVFKFTPYIKNYRYFYALIEHETCISLSHRRCFSRFSEFRTRREQGLGLGMITRAWRKNGSLRYDNLAWLRKRHPKHLSGVYWSNLRQKPRAQIDALLFLWDYNYKAIPKHIKKEHRMAMADAAYNGGLGRIKIDRRKCGLRAGCNPNLWWGNVEKTCGASKKPIYDTRSPCYINRHHVRDVMKVRMKKYKQFEDR